MFGIALSKYAIFFGIASFIVGAVGFGGAYFGGLDSGFANISKILFGLFLILTVVFMSLAALGVGRVKKAP